MDDELSLSAQKLQKCVIDSWKHVSSKFKNYVVGVNLGQKHMSLITAHNMALKNVATADIKDTELFKLRPSAQAMLLHNIKKEILSEETCIRDILNDLHFTFLSILSALDSIFNIYRSCNLSTSELCATSVISISIAEMLEVLDSFKRNVTNNHNARRHTVNLLRVNEEIEKISDLWNTSDLLRLKEDMDFILGVE